MKPSPHASKQREVETASSWAALKRLARFVGVPVGVSKRQRARLEALVMVYLAADGRRAR